MSKPANSKNTIRLVALNGRTSVLAAQLADFMNYDRKLLEALGATGDFLDTSDFERENKKWSSENNAQIYAIVMDSQAIGMISLSDPDGKKAEARTGYWIGSRFWNKGYGTLAFSLLLDIAKSKDYDRLSAKIPKRNAASIAIWKRHKAQFVDAGGSFSVQIYL